MSKVLIRHTDRTVYRELGFEDGYAKRKKRDSGFPTAEARAGYLEGYRLGTRQRSAER